MTSNSGIVRAIDRSSRPKTREIWLGNRRQFGRRAAMSLERELRQYARTRNVRLRGFAGTTEHVPRDLDVYAEVRDDPPLSTDWPNSRA